MKKSQLLSLFPSFIFLIILSANLKAQSETNTAKDIKNRISQVEGNLSGWVQTQDSVKWTLKERMAFYKIKGLSIAVVHNYRVEWAKGYGWADSAEHRPVTTLTLFQAGSISKSLNAVGILKLAQDEQLNLYTDINTYLTNWKFPYDSLSRHKKITIANLLSHTAGLSIHGFPGYEQGAAIPTLAQVLDGKKPANTLAVRSQFEPGLKFQYSGGGTTISQLILTNLTHQSYDKYMWESILKPMGMTNSFYTQPPATDKQILLATAYRANGSEVKGKYHIYPEEAAAGLWTNPTDLCKYIIETQLSYEGKSHKVLSQQFTKLRLTPYIDQSAALGVFIDKKGNTSYFQHGGADEGFLSQYYGSLEDGNGVVVMVNSDNGHILQEIVNSVAIVYKWKDFYTPVIKKVIPLTTQQLKAFEGNYQLQQNKKAFIQITADGDHLLLKQLWDGQEVRFSPESDLDFFCLEMPFPLKFIKDKDSAITQVLAFGRDLWDKVKD
ncbi:MAG TPA: serine hydrolase domain-containing protein [Puia sp.]